MFNKPQLFLTGSRYFQTFNENSDTDYVCQYNEKNLKYFENNGWACIETNYLNLDRNTYCVLSKDKEQIIMVLDVDKRLTVDKALRKSGRYLCRIIKDKLGKDYVRDLYETLYEVYSDRKISNSS